VTGVSRTTNGHGGNVVYQRLRDRGYEVFAVNPNADEVEGDPCYHDLRSIPGGVDGVVIVTRPEVTDEVVRDCGEAGVPRVWMHQSFKAGSSVSHEAANYCREHGITVIEGACPMMYGEGVDFGHRCMRWMLGLTGGLPT
jgi:predicted CoA-binding protein